MKTPRKAALKRQWRNIHRVQRRGYSLRLLDVQKRLASSDIVVQVACRHRGNWYNDQLRYDLARIVFILIKRLVSQAREYRNSLARLPAPAV